MEINELIRKKGLLRGLSPRTIKTYSYTISKFFRVCSKEPHQVTKNDLENYLLRLLERGAPGNTINVQLNALMFFFEQALNRRLTINLNYCKVPKQLPEFLTKEECINFFSCFHNQKHKLMVTLLYSAGLRVSELLYLKIKELQLEQNYGWVRQGKGRKDRPFIISEKIKTDLLYYINQKNIRAEDFLFNNHGKMMSPQTVRMVIKTALKSSDISKNVHPHTLRHSFATHLLENGYTVTELQPLLGHSRIETTLIYTHLVRPKLMNIQSPYDTLGE